jgi:hypothetical protein
LLKIRERKWLDLVSTNIQWKAGMMRAMVEKAGRKGMGSGVNYCATHSGV